MALPAAAGRAWDAGCSMLFALALQLVVCCYMHLGFVPNEAEQRQQQPRMVLPAAGRGSVVTL